MPDIGKIEVEVQLDWAPVVASLRRAADEIERAFIVHNAPEAAGAPWVKTMFLNGPQSQGVRFYATEQQTGEPSTERVAAQKRFSKALANPPKVAGVRDLVPYWHSELDLVVLVDQAGRSGWIAHEGFANEWVPRVSRDVTRDWSAGLLTQLEWSTGIPKPEDQLPGRVYFENGESNG